MIPGKGQIQTFLTLEPLMHEQLSCFIEETGKGHFDVEQKKPREYHILFWLAEGIKRYSHRMLLK